MSLIQLENIEIPYKLLRSLKKLNRLEKEIEIENKFFDRVIGGCGFGAMTRSGRMSGDRIAKNVGKRQDDWNKRIRHYTVPNTNRTFWQEALRLGYSNTFEGDEPFAIHLDEILVIMFFDHIPTTKKDVLRHWKRLGENRNDLWSVQAYNNYDVIKNFSLDDAKQILELQYEEYKEMGVAISIQQALTNIEEIKRDLNYPNKISQIKSELGIDA